MLFSLKMYHFYGLAPVTCTDGGDECAAQDPPDGYTSCRVGGGTCVGKSVDLWDLV